MRDDRISVVSRQWTDAPFILLSSYSDSFRGQIPITVTELTNDPFLQLVGLSQDMRQLLFVEMFLMTSDDDGVLLKQLKHRKLFFSILDLALPTNKGYVSVLGLLAGLKKNILSV